MSMSIANAESERILGGFGLWGTFLQQWNTVLPFVENLEAATEVDVKVKAFLFWFGIFVDVTSGIPFLDALMYHTQNFT